MTVIKRNGDKVPFNKDKIYNAVLKAYEEVYPDYKTNQSDAEAITDFVLSKIQLMNEVTVEQIQDVVENALIEYDGIVAKAYITYSYRRAMARDEYKQLMSDIKEKITAENVQNQNANVDEHSFGGRIGETADLVMKRYALDYCMSDMAKNNHLNNEIYIHDLSHYAVGDHNCLTVPFDDLLANGFNTRQTDVRPAQSVSTAFQLVAVVFQLQSLQQFGGVSASHLDWTMIPYVRKSFAKHFLDGAKYIAHIDENLMEYINSNKELSFDYDGLKDNYSKTYQYAMDMTTKEVYQAVEGLYHNLNTLQSRSGNQLPFTSINYGTCTLPEGRLVIKALLDVSIKGIGKLHKTSIFPCGIFQCMKGVNRKKGDPNYDLFQLALKSTAQRLYPNYANVDWSGNKGYDRNDPKTYFSTMGCRTANGWDINGFGQLKDGRGNICPVTIIMPTLAMEIVKQVEEEHPFDSMSITNYECAEKFMKLLDSKINEAKDMLLERFNWICSQNPKSAKFMYENNVMVGYDGKDIRSALKHGTLAIGQLGLAETLQILIGKDHTTEEGMNLAKRIEKLFKDRCSEFKEQYKLNFGVYFSPAENLCYTAMQKFKARYGEIPNVSDKAFFTNSMHVPVWEKMTPFEKIDIESQLTGYSSAGCITYVELSSSVKHNLEALEEIVNYAMDKDIPYFAINVPNDMCTNCGYTDEINDNCPMCGCPNIRRLRRVTGYLTGDYTEAFNKGKQQEVKMRVKHE